MFILTTIADLVQITPEQFQLPSIEAIEDNLNAKYSNRIVPKVGLGICVFDILQASDGLIGNGTGIVHVNGITIVLPPISSFTQCSLVEFRLVVFRPFKGEIILGRIKSASTWGIKVHLEFFDDILVPPNLMFAGSYYNDQEQCWVWNNEGAEYFYDRNEWVRVRVEQEHWHEQAPLPPSEREEAMSNTERKSPYSITASMMQSALGPTEWW
ncbi:DNA-directed RNA polymerase III subunit rpc25 [Agyrium rufum]|nr:DNA-directed RNA polymerase III subunit rpc25 [Agyrium rufum]